MFKKLSGLFGPYGAFKTKRPLWGATSNYPLCGYYVISNPVDVTVYREESLPPETSTHFSENRSSGNG